MGFLAAAGFLAATFLTAFLAGFSAFALLILKDPEAPVPLTCTKVPLVTRPLTAVLTRALFFSTSYPPATSAFLSAARDTPLLSLEAATALTMRSPTLGPTFLGLGAAFFLAAFAGAAAAGAGATSAMTFSVTILSESMSLSPC